jgi:anti-sigma regulatory factor (Ser/Thr protein kinase)
VVQHSLLQWINELQPVWNSLFKASLQFLPSTDEPVFPYAARIVHNHEQVGWLVTDCEPGQEHVVQALHLIARLLENYIKSEETKKNLTYELITAWDRLSILSQIPRLMRSITDPWALCIEALRLVAPIIGADNAFLLRQNDNNPVVFELSSGLDVLLIASTLDTKPGLLICNNPETCRETFPHLNRAMAFIGKRLRLNSTTTPTYFGVLRSDAVFSAGDIQIIENLVEYLKLFIDTNAMVKQQIVIEQLNHDLDLAAQLQSKFLPKSLPTLPGYTLAVHLQPASKVSGDFYDVYHSGDSAAVLVCDIAGKGMDAALLASNVRVVIRAQLQQGFAPGRVLQLANTVLYDDMSRTDRFATAVLATLQHDRWTLANAGHTTSFLIRANPLDVQKLSSLTLPLGVLPDIDDESTSFDMAPGDILVMYSDGLTEITNDDGKLLGMAGVIQVLLAIHTASPEFILQSLIETNWEHRKRSALDDDLTLVVIKRDDESAETPIHQIRWAFPAQLDQLHRAQTDTDAFRQFLPTTEALDTWMTETQLALTELVSNIVVHAYKEYEGKGSIHGLLTLYPTRLQIDLIDWGAQYHPQPTVERDIFALDELPEGGYGMQIIHQVMSVVQYQRLPNNHNYWRIVRNLPPSIG